MPHRFAYPSKNLLQIQNRSERCLSTKWISKPVEIIRVEFVRNFKNLNGAFAMKFVCCRTHTVYSLLIRAKFYSLNSFRIRSPRITRCLQPRHSSSLGIFYLESLIDSNPYKDETFLENILRSINQQLSEKELSSSMGII